MAPAPSQFSRLLQQSRLASYDPSIPQVYTAPKAFIARGEWGMKRPMPSTTASAATPHLGMLRYVEMRQLDSIDRQSDWSEREKETLFVKRWAEANTKLHVSRPDTGYGSQNEVGAHGPRPTTSFLSSSQRYTPSDIPGPVELSAEEEANESAEDKEVRLYNNKWRDVMKHHAARGVADPNYKGLDYVGVRTPSPIFSMDAEKYTVQPRMTTNYNALSDRQFEQYLARIRDSRGKWVKYYRGKEQNRLLAAARVQREKEYDEAVKRREEAKLKSQPLPPLPDPDAATKVDAPWVDMLEQSRNADATRDAFLVLEEQSRDRAAGAESKAMPGTSQASTMHPHAGLQYAQPDAIFANVLSEPLPGRVIHEISSRSEKDVRRFAKLSDGRSVLVGGRVGYLHAPLRSQAPPTIDWSRQDPKQGTALFRITDAYRTTSLSLGTGMHKDMLTPRNDSGYIRSNVELVKTNADGKPLNAPHIPGSAAYIGEAYKDPSRPVRRALGFGAPRDPDARPAYSFGQNRRNDAARKRLGRDPAARPTDTPQDSTKKLFDNLDTLVNPRD